MKEQQLLSFISNENLFKQVKYVLDIAKAASSKAEGRLFTNTIDPFPPCLMPCSKEYH